MRLVLLLALLSVRCFADDELKLLTHNEMRIQVEVGSQQGRGFFISPQYRFALHDILDRKGDFPKNTSIELLSIKPRIHFQNPTLWIDELTVFKVLRVPAMTAESDEWSWGVDLGARTVRENTCNHCIAGHLRGSLGFTKAPFYKVPLEFFLMAELDFSMSPQFTGGFFQPAVGPRLGIRLSGGDSWDFLIDGKYKAYFLSSTPHAWDVSAWVRYYIGWNLAVQARFTHVPDGWDAGGGVFLYF